MALFGAQCLIDTANSERDETIDVSESDEDRYDPSKPEFISPATPEEVERTGELLLAKQIAKLQAHAARRRGDSNVTGHYHRVLGSLRSQRDTMGCKMMSQASRHARSEPCLVQFQEQF